MRTEDIPKLGVILPTTPGQLPLIAFPLALPMGWVESPPYFTSITETACDLSNNHLRRRSSERPSSMVHRLETLAATQPPDTIEEEPTTCTPPVDRRLERSHKGPPLAKVDVYVDDFLLMAHTHHQRREVLRAALHSIDSVLRPLSPTDPAHRKEPASVKKMAKGDAAWSTRKRVIDWDIDTEASTLSLPPHRLTRLYELLDFLDPPRKRVSVKFWHKLLGELRSMAPALPGTRGLFSILQEALQRSDRHRIRITKHVLDMVSNFRALADSLHTRPTRLQELVPVTPSCIGASDASGGEMGGVWFSASGHIGPRLWRQRFTEPIQSKLVTRDNPKGDMSISDLKLYALIAQKDVLAQNQAIAETTIWVATDKQHTSPVMVR